MLRRNLIYTAITRSKTYLIMCGDLEAFQKAIQQTEGDRRFSFLKEKLIEKLGSPSDSIEPETVLVDESDPETWAIDESLNNEEDPFSLT